MEEKKPDGRKNREPMPNKYPKPIVHAKGKHRTMCGKVITWNTGVSDDENPTTCLSCIKRIKKAPKCL